MFDFSIMYDANFASLADDAEFTLTDSAATSFTIPAISKLEGVETFDEGGAASLAPAIVIRLSDLSEESATRASIEGATVTFQNSDWLVKYTTPRPSPNGEDVGELYVWLEEA